PERHRQFMQAHYQALLAYRPKPYTGRVTLLRARTQTLWQARVPDKGWKALALGGLEIRGFDASHHNLLSEPHSGELARQLQRALDEIA
ncbi:MAG: hypothetical protein IT318_04690, partial [Anaerolineales bacterium]|nr:hypothetical protein [Anaerolineales bacterium]